MTVKVGITRYCFENCSYITSVQSDIFVGKLGLRGLTNIATGEAMPCCAGCQAGGASFAREGWQNSRHSFALQ